MYRLVVAYLCAHCISYVACVSLNTSSTLNPIKFLDSAYNPDYPFTYAVPPVVSHIVHNVTLRGNFSYNSPYAHIKPTRIGDTYYYKVTYCGIHFINKGEGYIISNEMFHSHSRWPFRCDMSFVGSQFCTPSVECPWFKENHGSCRDNYVQITDYGETFLLHFCDDTRKPSNRSYTALNGVLDVIARYDHFSHIPDFFCFVKCVNYNVNFTNTGSGNNSSPAGEIIIHKPTIQLEENLPKPRSFQSCKCGVSNERSNRIVGGRETLVNQYPWTLGLMNHDSELPFCGASLINDRYALTAAHCVEDEDAEDLIVVLNEHDFKNQTETTGKTLLRGVAEIIMFPYYLETTFYGDIALLKFTHPVDITSPTLTPVCLPEADDGMVDGREVIGAGWGTTRNGPFGPKSPVLNEVPLVVMNNVACNDYHPHVPPEPPQVTDNMLCAGYTEGGRDTCSGDSGGPLFAKSKTTGRYSQVGVTSWGYGCALKLNPGVFSRVSSFLYWIHMNTVEAVWCS